MVLIKTPKQQGARVQVQSELTVARDSLYEYLAVNNGKRLASPTNSITNAQQD